MKSSSCKRPRVLAVLGIALFSFKLASALPVFPGAFGFGSETPAGRGSLSNPTTVIKVTTLADGLSPVPSGSLRAAINSTASPKVIVFEVAGVIHLRADLVVRTPYCTIAGQTAPSPGITLQGDNLNIRTHDVLVQHIAMRSGKSTEFGERPSGTMTPLNIRDSSGISAGNDSGPVYNVVIDRCSISWATDENLSPWADQSEIYDITWSNCLVAEPLVDATTGEGGYGAIVGRNVSRLSWVRNVFAFSSARAPQISDDCTQIQVVNNFIYGVGSSWHDWFRFGAKKSDNVPQVATVRGNSIYHYASHSGSQGIVVQAGSAPSMSIYEHDNSTYLPSTSTWYRTSTTPWNSAVWKLDRTITQLSSEPSVFANANVPVLPGGPDLEEALLPVVGARAGDRDVVDTRIINQIIGRTGGTVTSPPVSTGTIQTGWYAGYPDVGTTTRTLTLPANPDQDSDGDGYTNLEEWLHGYAAEVEGNNPLVVKGPDDFEDGNANGWNVESGTWTMSTEGSNDVYRQTSLTGGAIATWSGTYWDDYSVEAKVKLNSLPGSGDALASLMTRWQDATTYYTFMLLRANGGATSVAIKKRTTSGGVVTLQSASYSFSTGVWYTLKFEASGGTLKGYVNGSLVLTANDGSPIASGLAALNAYKADVSFDDVLAIPEGLVVPAPSGLSASSAAYNQINLSWTDNASNETGFKIERKKGVGGTYSQIDTVGANATSYNDTTAGTGTQYYYRVRAYGVSGDSGYSNEANATTAEIADRAAHWKFNETSGTSAADSSSNGNTATLSAGASFGSGKIGNALVLNGTSGEAKDTSTSGLNLTSAITLAAWVNADSLSATYSTVVVKGNSGSARGYGLNVYNGKLNFVKVGVSNVNSNVTLPTGSYQHVAVTWDASAGQVKFYLNGTLAETVSHATALGAAVNADPVSIGSWPTGGSWMDGALDDVRIYSRALSATEITAVHRAGM